MLRTAHDATINKPKFRSQVITKRDEIRLENNNMRVLDEIVTSAKALGLTLKSKLSPSYRRGSELKIVTEFIYMGDSGQTDSVVMFGHTVKTPRRNNNEFHLRMEVKFDVADKSKIDIIIKLNEDKDDGYLHENFAKYMMKQYHFENLIEVHGVGSELITIEKTI